VHNCIGNNISNGLFGQRGISSHQRKIGRQVDLDTLPRSVPTCGTDHALGHLSQIDPIATQFQCACVDPGDRQKIAHHFIEVFGFLLDLGEQIFLRRFVQLISLVDQAGGRTEY
jgi:hypothetical protein